MANTIRYETAYPVKLQERLDHPTNWKEMLRVDFTSNRVLENPFVGTYPSVQSHSRGTAYTFQSWTESTEVRTINTGRVLPVFIDRVDLNQSHYTTIMQIADDQGQLMLEAVESNWLSLHTEWTDFGTSDIGAGGSSTTQITVSSTNIDDIIRAIKRVIYTANGINLAQRNGIGIVWTPTEFEILEAFIQANGFTTADMALKDGAIIGLNYFGVDHFVTNDNTANHLFAGVKKTYSIGIDNSTWGQVVVIQDPSGAADGGSANNLSGVGIVVRGEWGFGFWNNVDPVNFDINIA